MFLFVFATSLLAIALWRLFRILRTHRRFIRTSDGMYTAPGTIPFIGQAHMFPKHSFAWTEFMVYHVNEAARQGHHLMRWWFANKFVVIMLDGETAKVLLESTVELRKGPDYAFFRQWLGNGVLVSDVEDWRPQRRMLTPIFHFGMLEQYTPTFNKYGRKLATKLAELNGRTELTDVSRLLTECALYNVTESVMGVQLNLDEPDCRQYMQAIEDFSYFSHVNAVCPLYIMFPFTWFLFGHGWATRRCVRELHAFSAKVVEDRIRRKAAAALAMTTNNGGATKCCNGKMANGENGKMANGESRPEQQQQLYKGKIMAFLDFLLALEGENKLTKEKVREQVDAFMFGGHDTISHVLMWFLWSMACHPHFQTQLNAEIVEHFGVAGDKDEEEQQQLELSSSDVNNLPFLDRCLRETMRMFPVIPVLERELQQDLRIGDQTLPRGCMVAISPVVIHHNEKVYPRHWEFDPDNFLPERVAKRSPYDYLPFSAGPRNCMGNRFATLELKVILVHVFRKLRFSTTIPFQKNRPALEAVARLELGTPLHVHLIDQ